MLPIRWKLIHLLRLFPALAVFGYILLLAAGTPPPEPESGKKDPAFLERLAKSGSADAQALLGGMYLKGRDVAKDYGRAHRWLKAAAEQNDAAAQRNLGIMYDSGLGVRTDPDIAARWFGKAMRHGDLLAGYKLGFGCGDDFNLP